MIVVALIIERSVKRLISKSQCSVNVGGHKIKEHNYNYLMDCLCISFYITTNVYKVFPNPISSHNAPDKLFLTKNPIHYTPSFLFI